MENALGNNIKTVRLALGHSQEQLAGRIEAKTSTVSLIESGRRFPSFPMLIRIRKALGCDWSVLLRGLE